MICFFHIAQFLWIDKKVRDPNFKYNKFNRGSDGRNIYNKPGIAHYTCTRNPNCLSVTLLYFEPFLNLDKQQMITNRNRMSSHCKISYFLSFDKIKRKTIVY